MSADFDSGLNVIAFVMIFLWVPETKQRTLEELDYICEFSHDPHLGYRRSASCRDPGQDDPTLIVQFSTDGGVVQLRYRPDDICSIK